MLSGLSMGLFPNPWQPNRMSQTREARHCKARAQAVLEQDPQPPSSSPTLAIPKENP
jgi:hypothetical protein